MNTLFHVSDQPDIELFVPRMPAARNAGGGLPVVWSVDHEHLANYLLPRQCPRVCFRATETSSNRDRAHFFGPSGSGHGVAIEACWFERAVTAELWIYEFATELFSCADANAGYFVSTMHVIPVTRYRVDNPLSKLVALGVELRVMPSVTELRAAVALSSLEFSCIRMRNAVA